MIYCRVQKPSSRIIQHGNWMKPVCDQWGLGFDHAEPDLQDTILIQVALSTLQWRQQPTEGGSGAQRPRWLDG